MTDEELAEVGTISNRLANAGMSGETRSRLEWRLVAIAPRLAREVRAGRLWKALALALIAARGRGNAPEVLRAIEALEQMGERVPAVVRLP